MSVSCIVECLSSKKVTSKLAEVYEGKLNYLVTSTQLADLCIMADGSLFECAPLCFLVNKYGRFSHNVLKSTFSDFYSGDLIVDAKNRLLEDLSNLNLTVPLPRIPKRRDSASRLNSEVDDIFNLLAFVDEQKLQ